MCSFYDCSAFESMCSQIVRSALQHEPASTKRKTLAESLQGGLSVMAQRISMRWRNNIGACGHASYMRCPAMPLKVSPRYANFAMLKSSPPLSRPGTRRVPCGLRHRYARLPDVRRVSAHEQRQPPAMFCITWVRKPVSQTEAAFTVRRERSAACGAALFPCRGPLVLALHLAKKTTHLWRMFFISCRPYRFSTCGHTKTEKVDGDRAPQRTRLQAGRSDSGAIENPARDTGRDGNREVQCTVGWPTKFELPWGRKAGVPRKWLRSVLSWGEGMATERTLPPGILQGISAAQPAATGVSLTK